MSEIELLVNGKVFTGWEEVTVTRTLETVSGSFQVSSSDLTPWPIGPQNAVRVQLAGVPVVTGYVDRVDVAIAGQGEHSLAVAGRDKTGDLVDCGVVGGGHEYRNLGLAQLAASICKPFGIEVVAKAAMGESFAKFAVQPGDSAWGTIERACRERAVLALADGFGRLVLTVPGSARSGAALVEGQNVLRARGVFDDSGRFSQYVVKGQGVGSDDVFGETVAAVTGKATDAGVKRYRPLVVSGENALTLSTASQRAKWEATVRAARAGKVEVEVTGWRRLPDEGPWAVNELVPCTLPSLGIKGDMLIAGVEFSLNLGGGTVTSLQLTRPDGYAVKPEVSKVPKDNYSSLFGD